MIRKMVHNLLNVFWCVITFDIYHEVHTMMGDLIGDLIGEV